MSAEQTRPNGRWARAGAIALILLNIVTVAFGSGVVWARLDGVQKSVDELRETVLSDMDGRLRWCEQSIAALKGSADAHPSPSD